MSGSDGEIRLGVLQATPTQLTQIVAWVADFRKTPASAEAVTEIGLERFDIYLIVVGTESDLESELGSLVVQAAFTPCLILATQDDDRLVDAALTSGATDYLALPGLDVLQLERTVQFSMGRRKIVDALTARETCLSEARERDRQRLANTLHDGPLQDLIGARFLLGALGAGGSAVDEIQSSLQQVIQSVRSLCSDLKPPALAPFGLEKAIRAHMQVFQTRHSNITVTLESDADRQQLPEWARMAFFRVFQEAVSNVVEHAQASHILVRLLLDNDQLRLTVADDGQGFEMPTSWLEFARFGRCGLLMMQERVDALQGRMMVQSTPGGGTRVMVQVPLDQSPVPLPAYLSSAEPESNG